MLLLYFFSRLASRFYRPLVSVLLSVQLAMAPVQHAQAFVPAVAVVVPISVFAARVFMLAASKVGSGLTAAGLTATQAAAGGIFGAGLLIYADKNWPEIVDYNINSSPSYGTGVSNGVPSFASIAGAVNVPTVKTDTTGYSWSVVGGMVTSSVGDVPSKNALPGDDNPSQFPSELRWDGYPKYQPMSGTSFSTVWNGSGFKHYLCPVLSPSLNEPDVACQGLPEMPYATYKYQSYYQSIGAGCIDPRECVKAYLAARLVHLSGALGSGTTSQGQPYYQRAIQNASATYGACFDSRTSQYGRFFGYVCPATLTYSQAILSPGMQPTFTDVTENLVINPTLLGPSFSNAASLNDYIDRYPLAGNEPLMPDSMAVIFNAMFSVASARAGYSGLGYFPITAAHVSAALEPGEYVPLSELIKPISASGSGSTPGTGNPTAPGGSVTVDLGPNPGIGAPTLEGIPTAAQIMSPIFDLFPSLKNFQVPGHTAQCPALVIPLWGQEVSTNKHCELIEGQRQALGAAALVGWSIAAIIIVLGA